MESRKWKRFFYTESIIYCRNIVQHYNCLHGEYVLVLQNKWKINSINLKFSFLRIVKVNRYPPSPPHSPIQKKDKSAIINKSIIVKWDRTMFYSTQAILKASGITYSLNTVHLIKIGRRNVVCF